MGGQAPHERIRSAQPGPADGAEVGVGWRGGLFNTWRMQPLSSWSTGCSQRAAEHRGPDQTEFCGLPETFQSDGDLMSGEGQHSEAF